MASGRYGYVPRTESPYEVLGLPRESKAHDWSDSDIATSYRRAALQAHPDKPNGSQEKFERVKASYELIKNEKLRQSFDSYGGRMKAGPGHALGKALDKLVPLAIGLAGGIILVAVSSDLQIAGSIIVITLGGGSALSYKASLTEVLSAGAGGMMIGAVIGSGIQGVLAFAGKLL